MGRYHNGGGIHRSYRSLYRRLLRVSHTYSCYASDKRDGAFAQGQRGDRSLKKIMEAAEKWNINIAIENQGNPEYLNFVFRNISSSRLYFCFDSGHERFYSPQLDLLDLYGDRLIALHLHDNNGQEDTHALPFTGDVQWDRIAGKLKKLDYKGAVALETLNRGFEHIESPVAFLQIALERAKKIL